MSEKRSRMLNGQKSISPLPKAPEPHPEKPPPNVPVPGEPSGGGKMGVFKCKICGKVFNSEDELQLHLKTDHQSEALCQVENCSLTAQPIDEIPFFIEQDMPSKCVREMRLNQNWHYIKHNDPEEVQITFRFGNVALKENHDVRVLMLQKVLKQKISIGNNEKMLGLSNGSTSLSISDEILAVAREFNSAWPVSLGFLGERGCSRLNA